MYKDRFRRGARGRLQQDESQSRQGKGSDVSPGKVTRTGKLAPPRLPLTESRAASPVQRKGDPAADPARADELDLTNQWLDTAVRPDLYPPPVAHEQAPGETVDDGEPVLANTSMAGEIAAIAKDGDAIAEELTASQLFDAATEGPAQELPYREEMEGRFGTDFSDVEVHLGAEEPLHAMSADAAASGHMVAFADRAPHKTTVAHELAHVVQARRSDGGAVSLSSQLSHPTDPAEREAEAVASAVVTGSPIPPLVQSIPAEVQRSFISFIVKMGAKRVSKSTLKNFVKTKIQGSPAQARQQEAREGVCRRGGSDPRHAGRSMVGHGDRLHSRGR